ncbi:MAG TPA: copper resistance protein B [Vicinamibacterales bacterium]|jgi:copper resistance protein B|nr:copper resistance protein B [Vicinamibacterales bacterium]
MSRAWTLAALFVAASPSAAAAQHDGHAMHDEAINTFVLVDQLEWQSGRGAEGISWDARGWIGGDRDRLWLRTEGTGDGGRLHTGDVQALYGRAISPWWDVVAGVRQDVRPGAAQAWAAFGIQGLAPYRIEIEATGYLGASGRTQLRLEAEYELLITNRLVLQPLIETDLSGQDDPARGVGAGLSAIDAGLRLRYEIRRELAPYAGVTWHRTFFGTAGHAEAAGQPPGGARAVVGLRCWL